MLNGKPILNAGNVSNKSSGSGNVVGPASSTDNAIARYDGTTGKLIQNSVVIVDDSGNTTGIGNLSASGNFTFSGLAKRIFGDFSNATRANRLGIQSSTTNGQTRIPIIPNGTSRVAGIDCYDGTDPDNASFLQAHADGTNNHVGLNSGKVGTGTTRPLAFQIDGVTKVQVNATSGDLEMVGAAFDEAAFVTVASATTCDIGAALSNNVAISGTTTITSFGTANAGITRRCRATGAFLITYNGTSLITKNGKNIVTKADDCFTMTSLGSGNWIMTQFDPADGRALANSVNNQTGTTYTLAITDLGNDIVATQASAQTYTLPQTSTVAFPIGSKIKIINSTSSGTLTFVKQGAETLNGNTTLIAGATAFVEKTSATSWEVFGGTAIINEVINFDFTGAILNQAYDLCVRMPFSGTIIGLTSKVTSLATAGNYTVAISGVNVTGLTTITNTTARTNTAATAANNFVAGDFITLTIAGAVTVVDFFGSLEYTRAY